MAGAWGDALIRSLSSRALTTTLFTLLLSAHCTDGYILQRDGDNVEAKITSLAAPDPKEAAEKTAMHLVTPCFDEACGSKGKAWLDSDGQKIEAHGAGMLQSPTDGRWYWYGESKKTANLSEHGVACYSAPSLAGPWRNEGQVLAQGDVRVPGKDGPWVIERPKVLYNELTRKFVMWFHLDLQDPNCCDWGPAYYFRHAAVATASAPTGPFDFVHALQPDGIPSLDMSLWMDVDKSAYFIRSCNNTYLGISRLSPDYLNTTGILSRGPLVEGMALFRHPNGTLYMLASHLTGWRPNPLMLLRSEGPDLSNPQWRDLGNPTGDETSFNTQPTFVVPFTSNRSFYDEDGALHHDMESYFIYMADNWVHGGPNGLIDASYVWLPIRFTGAGARIERRDVWDLLDPHAPGGSSKLRRSWQLSASCRCSHFGWAAAIWLAFLVQFR